MLYILNMACAQLLSRILVRLSGATCKMICGDVFSLYNMISFDSGNTKPAKVARAKDAAVVKKCVQYGVGSHLRRRHRHSRRYLGVARPSPSSPTTIQSESKHGTKY
jgi:hypothetical protein